jgi:hypothetical protein
LKATQEFIQGVSPENGVYAAGDNGEEVAEEELQRSDGDSEDAEEISDIGEEIELPEDGDEAITAVGLPKPVKPSQAEVEAHNRSHIPFRNWCEICVKGRAQDMPHKMKEKEGYGKPVVMLDYGYTKDDKGNKKDIKYNGKPIIVAKDSISGYVTANMVPRKGADPFAVKRRWNTDGLQEIHSKK